MARAQYLVLAFPASDSHFRRVAIAEIDGLRRRDGEHLQIARRMLRLQFPRAELHRQRAVHMNDALTEVWFAFRDGRSSPPCPPDAWWMLPGIARTTLRASGRLTGSNDAFRALFRIARTMPLVLARDVLPAALVAELSRGASGLLPSGEVTTHVVGGDPPMDLEFHAARDGARTVTYRIAVRTFLERDAANDTCAIRASSLGAMSRRESAELVRGASRRHLEQGERLSESVVGDPWMGLVVCGTVRLYIATGGLEPTVLYARGGSLVGTHLVSRDGSLALGLQAVTPTRIVQLDPCRVARARQSNARFAGAIAADGQRMMRNLVQTYAVRSSGDLGQRLARELLLIHDLQSEARLVPVTEQQLADGLGSIRESVARALGSFRQRGLVATTRYGVMPLEVEALGAVADGGDAVAPQAAVRGGWT